MTDYRAVREASLGHAGRLLHLPLELSSQTHDRGWYSSRDVTPNTSVFKELGLWQEWSPATSTHHHPSLPGDADKKGQKQSKWILKGHPEAHLGNQVLKNILSEVQSSISDEPLQEAIGQPGIFALGEMTDTSHHAESTGIPLLASAAGQAGNILCLAKPDIEQRLWTLDSKMELHLPVVSEHKPAYWDGPIGPIRRILSVVDTKRYDPTRWVIVQWDTETHVFQPEYSKVPVGTIDNSQITANHLIYISRQQTGGSSHSDAAFNPGTRANPPQLAIIDDEGRWCIWDIKGTRLNIVGKPIARLSNCGDLETGVTKRIPASRRERAEWHTIFFVGCDDSSPDNFDYPGVDPEESETRPSCLSPALERSSTLLLGNLRTLRLLDLNTGHFLPDLPLVPSEGPHRILDVQVYVGDARYIFVLTTSKLYVLGVFSKPSEDWAAPPVKYSLVLLSSPHFRDVLDHSLRLDLTCGPSDSDRTSILAVLHSSKSNWLDLFCMRARKSEPEQVSMRREVVVRNLEGGKLAKSRLSMVKLRSLKTIPRSPKASSDGGNIAFPQRVSFYQMYSLGEDLKLTSSLCALSYTIPIDMITPPDTLVCRTQNRQLERRRAVQHLASNFVVPDAFATTREPSLLASTSRNRTKRHDTRRFKFRFFGPFYECLTTSFRFRVEDGKNEQMNSVDAIVTQLLRAFVTLADTTGQGFLPATLLAETSHQQTALPKDIALAATELRARTQQLQNADPNLRALELTHPRKPYNISSRIKPVLAFDELICTASNLDNLEERISEGATGILPSQILQRMAWDLCISMTGAMTHPHQLFESAGLHGDNHMIETLVDSQREINRGSSPVSTADTERSNADYTAEHNEEDPAMALLRSFTGTGKYLPKKTPEILARWTSDVDPGTYVFDLDKEKEHNPGVERRAKQLARESRKRRRAERLLSQTQELDSELPITQPIPEIRFSQPRLEPPSSQPLQTMSQPLAGAFAKRPKKKTKRQGGFK